MGTVMMGSSKNLVQSIISGLSLKTKNPICVTPLNTALVFCSMGWEAWFYAICFVNLEQYFRLVSKMHIFFIIVRNKEHILAVLLCLISSSCKNIAVCLSTALCFCHHSTRKS